MQRTLLVALVIALGCLGACQKNLNLPPFVRGATSRGGIGYSCEPGVVPGTDPKFAQSPEIIERLRKSFPPGSPSTKLRLSLSQQGFTLEGACPSIPGQAVDPTVRWAQFQRNGNEVVAYVYWREAPDGQIVWTFGDVAYTYL